MLFTMLAVLGTWLQAGTNATFESDLWPEEGRPVFVAVTRQLALHELPSTSSKIIRRLSVVPQQRLVFVDTRYRTIKPGRFLALVSTSINGRMLGDVSRLSKSDYYSDKFVRTSVTVAAGDIVDYLQYRAEGTCFVRVADRNIDAKPCPTQQPTQFRLDASQ